MPLLDAASIDYSLLAGAESLDVRDGEMRSRGGKRQQNMGTANATVSSSSSASSASTPPTSDDEEEVQARKLHEEQEQEREKNKYAFRTPKKVVSQVRYYSAYLLCYCTN